jgi:hypothetical protein
MKTKPQNRFHISLAVFAISTTSLGVALATLAHAETNSGKSQLVPCAMGLFISAIALGNVLRYGGPK